MCRLCMFLMGLFVGSLDISVVLADYPIATKKDQLVKFIGKKPVVNACALSDYRMVRGK